MRIPAWSVGHDLSGSPKSLRAQTPCSRERTDQVAALSEVEGKRPAHSQRQQRRHLALHHQPVGASLVRTSRNRCLRCLGPAL
jgi:hypothetical protein